MASETPYSGRAVTAIDQFAKPNIDEEDDTCPNGEECCDGRQSPKGPNHPTNSVVYRPSPQGVSMPKDALCSSAQPTEWRVAVKPSPASDHSFLLTRGSVAVIFKPHSRHESRGDSRIASGNDSSVCP